MTPKTIVIDDPELLAQAEKVARDEGCPSTNWPQSACGGKSADVRSPNGSAKLLTVGRPRPTTRSTSLVYGGKPLQLLEMSLEGEIALVTSAAILDETLGVLATKFSYTAERLLEAQQRIESASRGVFTPGVKLKAVSEDPDKRQDSRVGPPVCGGGGGDRRQAPAEDRPLRTRGDHDVGEFLTRPLG
jgi:hypothetical protein